MGKMILSAFVVTAMMAISGSPSLADTVYLKSGGKINGVVVDENRSSVVIDIGNGTVTHGRNEIDRIEKNARRPRIYAPAPKEKLAGVFEELTGGINSVLTLEFLKRSAGDKAEPAKDME